jgi:eukaryotic translation initiation factor 2C
MEVACFPITIKTTKPVFNFDVSVEVAGEVKSFVVNKERSDPQDKYHCRKLLRIAFDKSGKFGGDEKLTYVYDGLSCLYASSDFPDQEITVELGDFDQELKNAFRRPVIVRVTRTSSNHELFIHTPPEKMPADQYNEFKRFLSLVVCQYAIDRDRYSVLDHGHLFSADNQQAIGLNSGIELRQGMSKGIRLVEDGKGVQAAFEVDFRMSAFYKPSIVAEALREFRNPQDASDMLKGARVCPLYNTQRSLNFASFSRETPTSQMFELDGKPTSVLDYFKKVKNQKIDPRLPLVTVRPKQAGFFPAEQLRIVPFQKVRIERLGPKLADTLHSYNAVLPDQRYKNISSIIRSLNLTDQNPVLKAFGVAVQSTFSAIPCSKIWRPTVQMGGTVSTPQDDGSFRVPAKYLVGGSVAKWAVLYSDRGVNPEAVKTLVQRLCAEGKNKGMTLPPPNPIQSVDMANFMDKAFINVAQLTGVSFILVIDPKIPGNNTHHIIKLIENRYKIVTQQLDAALVHKCVERNQKMTLENILNKMNLKIGGVNYAPKFEAEAAEFSLDKGTFVIGYQTAHQKTSVERVFTEGNVRITEPSVLGFTGNYSTNPNLFVGNWLYQDAEHEIVDHKILEDQMHHVLKILAAKRPNHAKPKTILVLRDGISEIRFEEFSGVELQALKNACTRIDANWKPKFVLVVTTKDHNSRVFLKNAKTGKIENPTPGSIIDYGVVRRGKEFLTTPQKAIKGTAQPVKVTVVKNESALNFEGIKKFVHALSYSHQLTCSPTGLCEPIYQAEILAQRGLSTLPTFKMHFPTFVPRTPDQQYDIDGLNKRLSMKDSRLELIRFTA